VQGFKKGSRSRLGYVKIFAISVDTSVTTLIRGHRPLFKTLDMCNLRVPFT
jgi:hypothetical protein